MSLAERIQQSKAASADETLSQSFTSLNRAKIKYVALSGFEGIPFNPSGELVLLTEDVPAVVSLLRLVRSPEHSTLYTRSYGGESENLFMMVRLIPKGEGYLPNRFETELLARADMYEDLVKIPQSDLHSRAILYEELFRKGWLSNDPERRKIVASWVESSTGPSAPCRIRGIPYTK